MPALRNVVPRQGTEIFHAMTVRDHFSIEKCSSPTGDGNPGSASGVNVFCIEKCSSPTGDGNIKYSMVLVTFAFN